VPEALRAREVGSGSARIFHDRRIHHTRAASGVLLYVSLLERRAVVLADRGAFEALGQDSIDDVCRGLTEDLRRGDVPAALCASVRRLGELLGKKLPRGSADRNELADALITID
jgi:putative membrane protein